MRNETLTERIKKLEDQVSWIVSNPAAVSSERVEKLEIQVSCLRKQVLDLEGKKSYSEEAIDEWKMADADKITDEDKAIIEERDVKRGLYGDG